MQPTAWDAIVIGSGFGGALAAKVLVDAGWRVLMLERGDWVKRGPENWAPEGVGQLTAHYSLEAPYVVEPAGPRPIGAYHCVGGPSVFYGGVSLRMRERDFEIDAEIAGTSNARWPVRYTDLEPFYAEAERIIGVAGTSGEDPTEPPRSTPYPFPAAELAPVSERIAGAARALGLHPFRLPLAINHRPTADRRACIACPTCDGFACAIEAKNDLATTVLRPLIARGLALEAGLVVTRLTHDGGRITGVDAVRRATGERVAFAAREVVLAAGAIATPHLLLASGLDARNPGGDVIGRYLMRHYNQIVFGVFLTPPDPEERFHKQIGIHDYYVSDAARGAALGSLGSLQQLPTPPVALARAEVPAIVRPFVGPFVRRLTGLLVIAEDQPQRDNRVTIDHALPPDRWGLPRVRISFRHSARDIAAGRMLAGVARRVLVRAGAVGWYRHRIHTFSHGVGTARMGDDPRASVVDAECRFRGIDNLTIADASVFPSSGAVNPSLTVAANALRAARALVARASTRTAAPRYAHVAD